MYSTNPMDVYFKRPPLDCCPEWMCIIPLPLPYYSRYIPLTCWLWALWFASLMKFGTPSERKTSEGKYWIGKLVPYLYYLLFSFHLFYFLHFFSSFFFLNWVYLLSWYWKYGSLFPFYLFSFLLFHLYHIMPTKMRLILPGPRSGWVWVLSISVGKETLSNHKLE